MWILARSASILAINSDGEGSRAWLIYDQCVFIGEGGKNVLLADNTGESERPLALVTRKNS